MEEKKEIILITGAAGRIGYRTAQYFSSHQFTVIGLDIASAEQLSDVEFVTVDLSTDHSVKQGLDYVKKRYGSNISSVIHLAAYYSFSVPTNENYERITVQGTRRLLEELKSFEVGQFLFASTMLVHKPTTVGQKITEESPVNPTWGYPLSKMQAEKLIHTLQGNMSVVNLRMAEIYDDDCHSIPLSNQMQRIFENQLQSHLFAGDSTHGVSFLHRNDLISALALCVQKKESLPKEMTLLLGEEVTFSYDQIQRMMQRAIHEKEWTTFSLPKPVAKIALRLQEHLPFIQPSFIKPWMIDLADNHYELDTSRAKQLLGWQPKYRLDKVIPYWAKQLKKDPKMWYHENKLS